MEQQDRKQVWEKFIKTGELDPGLPPLLARSWQECRRLGVDPWHRHSRPVSAAELKNAQKKSRLLLQTALPLMQSVHAIIRSSHFLLALTDASGCVLHTLGDEAILARSENILFRPGSVWRNDQVGTNGPGMALEYGQPIQLVGAEHYCADQHGWTCSAAPIHGRDGQVIGCLDLSGSVDAAHPHTLALVIACAFSIEQTLALYHQNHFMRTAANGLQEAVLLLNEKMQVRWANRTARRELGLPAAQLQKLSFQQLLPKSAWQEAAKATSAPFYLDDLRLELPSGVRRFSATLSYTADAMDKTYTLILRRQEHMLRSVNRVAGNQATYTFDDIYAADPLMLQVIERARQYARYDGSVLIEGESGTGKELFAQSVHAASERKNGPFVAVNCASLPRDLIESELFGYEKGAFTGALKEGNPGKFELADGGTLFLDEIGEMPLEFQAKLLRAVETLRIRRIGGKEEKKLDVRIIAATNRHLDQEAARGNFRADLYYRLNVLNLTIPPLRQRPQDILYCARHFLGRLNQRYPDRQHQLAPEAVQALQTYRWPGNVRELQNTIERAFYTSTQKEIRAADLALPAAKPETVTVPAASVTDMTVAERQECLQALQQTKGQVEQAAALLGVSRATFYRLCHRYGLQPKYFRRHLR